MSTQLRELGAVVGDRLAWLQAAIPDDDQLLDPVRKLFVLSETTRLDYPDEWRGVVDAWMIALVVVVVSSVALMIAVKWFIKAKPGIQKDRVWPRGKTIGFILAGLLPAVGLLFTIWLVENEYRRVVEVGGLLTGTFICWIFYVLSMAIAHAMAWRRDLY